MTCNLDLYQRDYDYPLISKKGEAMGSGRKRIHGVVTALMVIMLVAGVFAMPHKVNGDSINYTTENYDVKVKVNKDYTYDYTETITVNFTDASHGIYRDISMDGSYRIKDIRVEGDNFDVNKQDGHKIIRIGDADRYVTGRKTYTIKYTLANIERSGKPADIYADVLPSGWNTPIDHASVTMYLPSDLKLKGVKVYAGGYGSDREQKADWNYDKYYNTITFEKNNIPSRSGVTFLAGVPDGYWVDALSIDWVNKLAMGLAALGIAVILILRLKTGKSPEFAETVEFYPPEDMNPVQLGYVIDNNVDTRDITAMFFYMAHKGYIKINQVSKKKFMFEKVADVPAEEDKSTQRLFRGLFTSKADLKPAGYSVTMEEAGDRLGNAYETIKSHVESYYTGDKALFTKSSENAAMLGSGLFFLITAAVSILFMYRNTAASDGFMLLGMVGLFAAVVLTGLMLKFRKVYEYRFSRKGAKTASKIGIWAVVYLIACAVFIAIAGNNAETGLDRITNWFIFAFLIVYPVCIMGMKTRTKWSAKTMAQILGFRNFIKSAELPKLNALVEEDPDYFYNILPYAYVMGLTNVWAKKFEQIKINRPEWFTSYDVTTFAVMDAMRMNHLMDTMYKSAATTIVTSSDKGGGGWGSFGGGGGFSGGGFSGGGSGGGGGGAW